MFDDEPRVKKPSVHEVGSDLSALSIEELAERVELLRGEIERLQKAKADKEKNRDAASALFKS
ncbi:MAG: DUF1192 domain-containing protein [Rhodobiaceae bacterium]|nr:DUF1192 domain-containing protein [Rhodobiaceae bacterium]